MHQGASGCVGAVRVVGGLSFLNSFLRLRERFAKNLTWTRPSDYEGHLNDTRVRPAQVASKAPRAVVVIPQLADEAPEG